MNIDLKFVTPKDLAEFEEHAQAIQFLGTFLPWPNFMDIAKSLVPCLTIVYEAEQGIVLAAFAVILNKKSAELRGVYRQDLRYTSWGKRLPVAISDLIFQEVFEKRGKDKIIIKPPRDAKGGRGFALMHGFKQINVEDGAPVYKLTRDEYLRRKHGTQQQAKAG